MVLFMNLSCEFSLRADLRFSWLMVCILLHIVLFSLLVIRHFSYISSNLADFFFLGGGGGGGVIQIPFFMNIFNHLAYGFGGFLF